VVLVLGAVAFAAMGLGITGLVRSSEGSSAVINAVYLPMAIISGTFFTPRNYPGFLKAIANILPLTHYTKLTRDVMLHNHHFWADGSAIAVVALWGAVGLVGAVRGFRWQPRSA
jgi:ABC-2 type transport system permease protein